MHIVFLDTKTLGNVPDMDKFTQLGKVTRYETTLPDQILGHIADAEVIVTNKVMIGEDVMAACPALKLICISATGMNNVDLQAAARRGILVKNVVGYSTESVTQHTFAMLFQLLNKLNYYDNYVKSGGYADSDIFTHYGPVITEISGKTMGIIGLGNIGKSVARVATAFGAEVIFFSSSGNNHCPDYQSVSLKHLLEKADIISIHAPLNDRTRDLISLNELKSMKKTAILINVGRGGIVDEAALAKAIDDEMIAGACIDVFVKEPILTDNPLTGVRNRNRIVLSPHNAWASLEARIRLMDIVYKNIEDYKKGLC